MGHIFLQYRAVVKATLDLLIVFVNYSEGGSGQATPNHSGSPGAGEQPRVVQCIIRSTALLIVKLTSSPILPPSPHPTSHTPSSTRVLFSQRPPIHASVVQGCSRDRSRGPWDQAVVVPPGDHCRELHSGPRRAEQGCQSHQ